MADEPNNPPAADLRRELTPADWRKAYGIPEAILLGILTAMAYLGAYVYKINYARYFEVPLYLVRVGTETLIQTTMLLGFFVFFVSEPLLTYWSLRKVSDWPSRIARWSWAAVAGFVLMMFTGYGDDRRSLTIGLLLLLALVMIVELLGGVLGRRYPPRPRPALIASFRLDPRFMVLGLVAFFVVVMSATFGEGAARRERDFLTFEATSKEYVVIAVFDDYVVAKNLYREKHEVGHALRIVSLSSMPTTQLERIGPLHLRVTVPRPVQPARSPVLPALPSPPPAHSLAPGGSPAQRLKVPSGS
jgi:hypothetical protein